MNRIDQLFQTHKDHVLSIYFCAGTPTLEGTAEVIRTLERKGVQMIEIGIPFSDPMADGPVIQHAATQALRNGMTLRKLFSQLEQIRTDVRIPLVLMGYLNPIMQYGFENFCRQCQACGIDGVIIPDLRIHLYGIFCGRDRSTKGIQCTEAGLLPAYQANAVTKPTDDRVRYLQQIHLRIGSSIRLRMHHRKQIRDLARRRKKCRKSYRQTVGNAKKRRIINHSAIFSGLFFQSKHIFAIFVPN